MNRSFSFRRMLIATGAALAAACGVASADIHVYTTSLNGANENPSNGSPGTGFVRVTYDDALHTLRVESNFTGLIHPTTAAHIHGLATPPANVGVAIPGGPSFADFPLGVTSGGSDDTLDLTLASSYRAAFITNFGGGTVAGAEAALIGGLETGRTYFNIHTSGFPAGEIRGWIPEPSSALLLTAGIALALRRRG
ncbi:MAG: CHRD domain-containing protein [Phycisphaerales bacterium]|nr:CHRD domain-containing protein [Phycisphaerales bacterium]